MDPKDCKNVKKHEKKKPWHQLSTWGSLSGHFYIVQAGLR